MIIENYFSIVMTLFIVINRPLVPTMRAMDNHFDDNMEQESFLLIKMVFYKEESGYEIFP